MSAGTIAATVASAPAPPAALEVADELAAAELVPDDELLLLLPHPVIAAVTSSETATESQLLRVRIALLLIEFLQKTARRICNNALTGWNF
jgi:hypothetical protein